MKSESVQGLIIPPPPRTEEEKNTDSARNDAECLDVPNNQASNHSVSTTDEDSPSSTTNMDSPSSIPQSQSTIPSTANNAAGSPSTTNSPSTNMDSIPPSTCTPNSQNIPSSPSIPAAEIKVIDFGYAASSPLHRPVWAAPLDEQSEGEGEEEFEEEFEEDEEGEGEGELEPGLYRAVYAFEAEGASEVSLERGQVVRVVGRGGGVGWAVVLDEREGKKRHALVPESYLVREE